ncbi:uncharacterized protein LOC106669834 isoform X2 [Cimex lectularius]|uniref:Secreted protein n=1 Tax=Cimex lectularius TaxID=79782 RepID=A0A8I6RYZ3_CIMLE|nr:uncharacterized protein LOC106669834 isoform X2 [Cimex lectularius]XP_014255098.1 uncharacterized protein LOC106669834 isoform X2 [Cimex lectularius]
MNLILVTLVLIWPLLVLSEEQKDCVLLKLHERHKRQLKEIGKIIMRTPNCFAAVSQELQVRLPAYYRQFAALIVYLGGHTYGDAAREKAARDKTTQGPPKIG